MKMRSISRQLTRGIRDELINYEDARARLRTIEIGCELVEDNEIDALVEAARVAMETLVQDVLDLGYLGVSFHGRIYVLESFDPADTVPMIETTRILSLD